MHLCEWQSFQAHHVNSLTVTIYDLLCVTGLLIFFILCCKIYIQNVDNYCTMLCQVVQTCNYGEVMDFIPESRYVCCSFLIVTMKKLLKLVNGI